ncbi:MAG: NUDIX hydrolase [Actinobacteria bacterium]|nr:NUDIX hydrolase [Actinomycetota bacterium]
MASTIVAAGVVLVRRAKSGVQVCLVHRPRQDDWSLPKGKADPGEMMPATARREALEETGSDVVLGAPLEQQRYKVDGRPKTVDYWVAHVRPGGPGFAPNREVDRLEWMSVQKARARLTYPRDRQLVLGAIASSPTAPFIVLRHTEAVKRADFKGSNDSRRPLTSQGRSQARALVDPISAFGAMRIHSSDSRRCMQTVEPLAQAEKCEVSEEPRFSEESFSKRPKVALRRLASLAATPTPLVLCTHRPVLPSVLGGLAAEFGLRAKAAVLKPDLNPGGFVVLHRELDARHRLTGRVVAIERFDEF